MEWLNLHTKTLDSPEFIGSDPVERATWLCLMRYCAGQENGGIIADCKAWKDRQWQQLCRVTLAEVRANCRLYWWDGRNLRLFGYPTSKESEVRRKREAGRITAGKRWGDSGAASSESDSSASSSATSSATSSEREQADSSASSFPEPIPIEKLDAEGEGETEGETETEGEGSGADAPDPPAAGFSANDLAHAYNRCADASHLPLVSFPLNVKRVDAARMRLREHPDPAWWAAVWRAVPESPFLLGDNDRGWRLSFDFLVRPGKAEQIVEGAYRNGNGRRGPLTAAEQTMENVRKVARRFAEEERSA
jgi:hypothetical protein